MMVSLVTQTKENVMTSVKCTIQLLLKSSSIEKYLSVSVRNRLFSHAEVYKTINTLDESKYSSPDGVLSVFLKRGAGHLAVHFA